MVRPSASEARVTFVVRRATAFGQRLRIVGDHAALGGWDPLRGPELTTSVGDHPTWRISVTLPASRRFVYKYVCMAARHPDPFGAPDPAVQPAAQPAAAQPAAAQPAAVQPAAAQPADSAAAAVAAAAAAELDADDPDADAALADSRLNAQVAFWETFDDNRTVDTEGGATMVVDDGQFNALNEDADARVTIVARRLPRHSHSKEKDLESEGRSSSGAISPVSNSADQDGVIIVLYRLPIIAEKDRQTGQWQFAWDDDALYLTSTGLRRGLEELKVKPLWLGILNTPEPVPLRERDTVAKTLLDQFQCVPVFLSKDINTKFYQGFCKGTLWPLFHMLTKVSGADGKTARFDQESWHAYQRVNRQFSSVIVERYEKQIIWVHDYHLMLLPYYLRIKLSGVKIGFFLHIPWPSSEIFRMLPVRNEILKGLLSSTMLGFHLFDYARHFLSGCVRLLNLEHEAKRGSLGIDYEGRHVMIRVSHIGVDPERFLEGLGMPHVRHKAAELEAKYPSKVLLGAIDDLDVIKGIALKLIAFEDYLATSSHRVRKNVALIQVALPKAARVEQSVQNEIRELVDRINSKYGSADHKPVLYLEQAISFEERIALYSVCDALLLTPIRDGLNLIPYEYIVSTPQGKGQIILSEFTGCSRALSSAVRVNPWNTNELRDAIDNVIQKRELGAGEIRLKHEADRKYVTMHSSLTWADSFLVDLKEATESAKEVVRLGLSRSSGYGRLEFEDFKMLNLRAVVRAYRESKRRLFLFDYDGTLTQIESESSRMAHTWAKPTEDVLHNLELLSKQENCTVVILSGRDTSTDGFHLGSMKSLGIAAEHGFYYKKPGSTEFDNLAPGADLSWIEVANRIMQMYTERTDGSYIEEKTAGLVWHYLAADPEFGGWQAKEMHDHLESILTPFNVQVVNGHGWLQVRLANVNKGNMVAQVLNDLDERPDFILCCGDDRTDEDMFQVLKKQAATSGDPNAEEQLFTATVGVKPSNASYYLRSSGDVAQLIEGIIEIALPGSATHVRSSTLEDMRPGALRRLAASGGGGLSTSASSGALEINSVAQPSR